MTARGQDFAVAATFLGIGLYLIIRGAALPEGMGRLPGPGFFPIVLGGMTSLLALALAVQTARRPAGEESGAGGIRQVAGVAALTFVYLLLWGSGLFALRTAVFLALMLRFLGQPWKQSALVSAALTAAVTLAFQYGLGVSLE